jgi:hypothetical protein
MRRHYFGCWLCHPTVPADQGSPESLAARRRAAILVYIADQMETIEALDEIVIVSNHLFVRQFEEWAKARNTEQSRDLYRVLDVVQR